MNVTKYLTIVIIFCNFVTITIFESYQIQLIPGSPHKTKLIPTHIIIEQYKLWHKNFSSMLLYLFHGMKKLSEFQSSNNMKYIANCKWKQKSLLISALEIDNVPLFNRLKPLLSFSFKSTHVLQYFQLTITAKISLLDFIRRC